MRFTGRPQFGILAPMSNPPEQPSGRSLILKIVRRVVVGNLALIVLLFVPAGTPHFWQAWVFLAEAFLAMLWSCTYFYRHDRQALERRFLTKETVGAQKLIMRIGRLLSVPAYLLVGVDHRLGWTPKHLTPVPLWLTWLALLLVAGGYALFFSVLKANRFAASVIQIEAGQTVITTGPYRLVRHPMYLAGTVMSLATPVALGSFVAVPVFAAIALLLVLRLLQEEKMLRRDLPGYADYCQRTPWRLVPLVW